jgi:hypothetical protein
MPSSISSSEPAPAAERIYERPVPALGRSGLAALLVALLLLGGWEAWVRSQGVTPSYRNSEGLWAEQRRMIDRGAGDGWVFTGSSRVLFNLQLDVWERLDGRRPVQLALEGSSAIPVMEQLAEDPDFTGMLLVGVAPDIFFSGFTMRRAAIDRYASETPTQWFGHKVSTLIEPYLAFYNFDYALPAILRRQPLPPRAGVEFQLEVRKLSDMGRDRNTRMWDRLERDEDYRNLATQIWEQFMVPVAELPPEAQQRILDSRREQIDRAVAAYDKLTARGATVIFVQMPFEGGYTESEEDFAPRTETWDVLLARTGALGLHFADHPEMQGYWLPEWSHMTGAEADRFTEVFYRLVQRELAARRVEAPDRRS